MKFMLVLFAVVAGLVAVHGAPDRTERSANLDKLMEMSRKLIEVRRFGRRSVGVDKRRQDGEDCDDDDNGGPLGELHLALLQVIFNAQLVNDFEHLGCMQQTNQNEGINGTAQDILDAFDEQVEIGFHFRGHTSDQKLGRKDKTGEKRRHQQKRKSSRTFTKPEETLESQGPLALTEKRGKQAGPRPSSTPPPKRSETNERLDSVLQEAIDELRELNGH